MSNKIKFRLAAKDDIPELLRLNKDSLYEVTYNRLYEHVENSNIIVAIKDKIIVGFIVFALNDKKFIKIFFLTVHEDYRKQGIGNELLRAIEHGAMIEKVNGIYTVMKESFSEIIAYFEKRGYVLDRVLRPANPDRENKISLCKFIAKKKEKALKRD